MQKEMNLISPINTECFNEILEFATIEKLDKNDLYSREGTFAKKLTFVCEGVLRIFHTNDQGEEWNKHFIVEHDFFSASSNPETPSTISIQAITKVIQISVPLNHIYALAKKDDSISKFIQKLITLTLEKEQQRGLMLMSLDAIKKYEFFTKTFPKLENRITHYYIASYLGITPTQLSRVRKKISSHQQM